MSTGFLWMLARLLRFRLCAGLVLVAHCRRRGDDLSSTRAVKLLGFRRSNIGTSSSHDAAASNASTAALGDTGCADAADLCLGDQSRYDQSERRGSDTTNKIWWIHCFCLRLVAGEAATLERAANAYIS